MFVNSDGTKSIMNADGTVQNFDRTGNPLPSGSVDAGNVDVANGLTEQQLYEQELAAQQAAQQAYDQQMLEDYQNYYETQAPSYYE